MLVICGPTAVGKSSIALGLAGSLGAELVNADSRQIYRGLTIGTNAPIAAELRQEPHHLYGFLDPAERYSAARFAADARGVLGAIAQRGHTPIVVGGTGFYLEALMGTMRLDRPPGDETVRQRLHAETRVHPKAILWEWLQARSPARAARIKPGDSYRVLRALEQVLNDDRLHDSPPVASGDGQYRFTIVLLDMPRAELTKRIVQRVHEMFASGLVREAVGVRESAPNAPALSGLGYAEALALNDGLTTEREAQTQTILRTERYAKRQRTWFRHMRVDRVVDALDQSAAIDAIAALARERFATT